MQITEGKAWQNLLGCGYMNDAVILSCTHDPWSSINLFFWVFFVGGGDGVGGVADSHTTG